MNLWTTEGNPETGKKFESFLRYYRTAHNGSADIDSFISSEYGAEFGRKLNVRFHLEDEPGGEAEKRYYASLGLKKEYYETERFYTRWFVVSPLTIPEGKKLPLVIANHGHGNPVEAEEYAFGFGEFAAQEGFMFAFAQNTNPDNIFRIIGLISERYPVDSERIYITGYSQGGQQTIEALTYKPELFAGAAPCGCDVFKHYDKFQNVYTKEQFDHLTEVFVPFMQVLGACELLNLVPLSIWKPKKVWEDQGAVGAEPPKTDEIDPTDARDENGELLRRRFEAPKTGEDPVAWRTGMLNERLRTLGCQERDVERCRKILSDGGENEVQKVLGIYADEERVETYYGYKHYTADIKNADGMLAFRYVAVENSPHWVPAMTGRLVWNFFKQYKRSAQTGKIELIKE